MTRVPESNQLLSGSERERVESNTTLRQRFLSGGALIVILKLGFLAVANAVGVFGIYVAVLSESWFIVVALALILIAIDWVYLFSKSLPAKYLLPGLLFLAVYQVFVMGYTGYIAFTNYGDGHNSNQKDAIEAILVQNEVRVDGLDGYPLTVVANSAGAPGFAIVDQSGQAFVGYADEPLVPASEAVIEGGRVVEIPDTTVLSYAELSRLQNVLFSLRVPLGEDPQAGSLRTTDGLSAFAYRSSIDWNEAADTMTSTDTGKVYKASEVIGAYVADDGSQLTPGWRVWVGWDNFASALLDTRISGAFFSVLLWTLAFATISTLGVFAIGLGLALLLNVNMRGQKTYRSLLIFPYGFPMFLSVFVWYGMLNTDFGFINQVLFDGAKIAWLTEPWLARFSVLFVNFWLGFPYMFLICTGALQSIPEELDEAARMDGANAWKRLWSIKIPLLLISVAPVLISTFAFNFNNFNVIYLLTGGGPNDATSPVQVGATDILISFVYKLAFGAGSRDFGLASAISLMIFLIVGVIAVVGFRQTRRLEEVYQ